MSPKIPDPIATRQVRLVILSVVKIEKQLGQGTSFSNTRSRYVFRALQRQECSPQPGERARC